MEILEELLSKKSIEQKYIDNHFISNRSWKNYFLSKHPDYNEQNYLILSWTLLKENGYNYDYERYSKYPDSKLWCAIREINLNHNYEFIYGLGDLHECYALSNLMITAICDFEIDVNLLK